MHRKYKSIRKFSLVTWLIVGMVPITPLLFSAKHAKAKATKQKQSGQSELAESASRELSGGLR